VGLRDAEPELLSRARIGALVDVDAEDEQLRPHARDVKESQEEFDQRGIAVDEADSLLSLVQGVAGQIGAQADSAATVSHRGCSRPIRGRARGTSPGVRSDGGGDGAGVMDHATGRMPGRGGQPGGILRESGA
jgi:hypothetical protein